ncbi:nitroreductase [Thermodesulfobacteriota bacterium]
MNILEAIRGRKSIRGYKPDPVPQEILSEILEAAGRAPSTMNTQPWEFHVMTGDVLDKVRQGNVEKVTSGTPPEPEHVMIGWSPDSVFAGRPKALGIQLFQLMGVERGDKEKRDAWMLRGFRFFDAPAAIVIVVDNALTTQGPLLDIGLTVQTICLGAMEFGLGTCIEGQGVSYPDVVRSNVDIPDSKKIIISIAIGYPDWDYPANNVAAAREPLENTAQWYGF